MEEIISYVFFMNVNLGENNKKINNEEKIKIDFSKIKDFDSPSLFLILRRLRSDYQTLIVSNSLNNLKEKHKIKAIRRNIARILTVINYRKIEKKNLSDSNI